MLKIKYAIKPLFFLVESFEQISWKRHKILYDIFHNYQDGMLWLVLLEIVLMMGSYKNNFILITVDYVKSYEKNHELQN